MVKTSRKITIVLVIIIFFAGVVGLISNNSSNIVYAGGDEIIDTHNHNDMTAWSSATSLPTAGSYYLTSDVRISTTCTVSGTLNLCLNGHGIIFTGTTIGRGSVFNLQAGKTLNLYDCGETEHKYRIQPADIGTGFSSLIAESPAGLATVDAALEENYQTFTGGYITGGIGMTNNNTYYNGGAVYILGGTFNMYGGTLIGNTVKNPSSSGNNGGAVYVVGGNFTMYDGAFIGNTVDISNGKSFNCGGAIYASTERVNGTQQGANVKIHGGIFKQNYAVSGGAFFVGSSIGGKTTSFEVNNATITENVGYVYQYSASGHGGVMYAQGGNITFRNCEISENISTRCPFLSFSATMYSSDKNTYNLTIDSCNITNNISQNDSTIQISGQVYDANVQCLVANISNTHIDNNKSISYGSAINISGYSRVSSVKSVQLTMTNSTINNNVINASSCAGMQISGNTSYYNGPEVTLTDCEISGNIAKYSGETSVIAGVGFSYGMSSKLNISGKVVIANNKFHNTRDDVYKESNLYFSDTKNTIRINVIDELSEDSLIGVVKYIDPYYTNPKTNFGTGVFTTGLNSKGSIDNFFSDKDEFYITEENGEAVLNAKAKVTYNKNNIYYGSAPATGYYVPNVEQVVVADQGTLRTNGYEFVGWNTNAEGTGTLYKPGDTIDISEDITLYAIFKHGSHDGIDFVLWTDELALEQNGAGKTASNSLPSVAGDYFLEKNVQISSSWVAPVGETNLCLNGHGIKMTGTGSVIIVDNGVKLVIHDCDDDRSTKHYYTSPSSNYGKATNISDTQASGQYYFTGGYIAGGTGTNDGGGDNIGGALLIRDGGDVTIYKATLIGNSAKEGGAIWVWDSAKLTLNGTRIRYNETVGNNTWNNGAGIYNRGTLNITGGAGIVNNLSCGNGGGGLYIAAGTVNIDSGSISNNAAKGNKGAGICYNYGKSLSISGAVYVVNNVDISNSNAKNNLYFNGTVTLKVTGEITSNASSIGVTLNSARVFTSSVEENLQYNNETKFFSDSTSYQINTIDGQLSLLPVGTVASVKNGETTTFYTSFADALNNWADGTTLKLLADVSGTQVTTSSGTKTLDLNNHSVTYTSGSVIIVSGGTLNIKDDSTSKTKHYYNINTTGVASISTSTTNNYFEGGYITGGVGTEARGGGLRVTGGEVNFAGGTIFACKAGWGGGIWTAGTSLVTISDSAAIIGCYSSGSYTSGGGIFCEGSGAITMTGGSIRHNSSQFSGGGVRVCLPETSGTYFTMTGGEITGNYSGSHQGSGLALDLANRIKIGGSARIYGNDGDNLFLKNGGYVTVVEQFTEDALIYVKTQTLPTVSNSILITDGWSTVMQDADFKNIFKWNDENYRIKKNSSGELVASVLHVHNWVYTAENNVITATCETGEDCTMESQTVTIDVTGKDYDGTAVVASISKSEGWTVENGLAEPGEIVYSGNINAGTYTVSITINDVTISKEFTISQVDVTVTIVGHTGTFDYDSIEHIVSGYDASASSELYDLTQDYTFSGMAEVARVNAGTSTMGLIASQFANVNANFVVTFNVTDGDITVLPINATVTIVGHNGTFDYNGVEHIVSGYDVIASTELYDLTQDYTFSGIAEIARVNAGTTAMGLIVSQFENTNVNFVVTFDVTDGGITITPINVTVTIVGNSDVFDYDSTEHTVSGYDVSASSELYDLTQDYTFSGIAEITRINAGTSAMRLEVSQFENINDNFVVTFNITDGGITIAQLNIIVTIVGNSDVFNYDCTEHIVSGYDASASSMLYNLTQDYTFSGIAEITRVNAGTSTMGLIASQFANVNANFVVTFNVTDGEITVLPINATVTIVGHNGTFDYNGVEHIVSGYDVIASTELYDVTKDFTFNSVAEVVMTNAGTSAMGLDASQFKNVNTNFAVVTFNVTDGEITILPINAIVAIVGHTGTFDYNGVEHIVSGYDVIASTELYDITKDFTFSGIAEASRTKAGTTAMGLDVSQFANTNNNFAVVTFNVTDGAITITAIEVTVTIVGQNYTLDYDGTEHSAFGYDVSASTELYDLTQDYTFSGLSESSRKNAGTSPMGLDASQFENINDNFVVTFDVTDGFVTILKVDSIISVTPKAKELIYNGELQNLITQGYSKGGILIYALSANPNTAPNNEDYKQSIPTAKETGYYYVWYKVMGDINHKDIAPVCLKVVIAKDDWVTLDGIVYEDNGETPISKIYVELTKGNQVIDFITTDDMGKYYFIIPKGAYNIVVGHDKNTKTSLVSVFNDETQDIAISDSKTNSVLEINTDNDEYLGIVVGGLDSEAYSIRETEGISENTNVSVLMTIEPKAQDVATNAEPIIETAENKLLEFLDVKVEKTIGTVTTILENTTNIMEIVVPYTKINRHNLVVYSYHDEEVKVFTEINLGDAIANGTFRLDKENGYIYIYTSCFSTFAIGYTPHYNLNTTISLGSYTGTISATISNGNDVLYTLENVGLSEVSFCDLPVGQYVMTITWEDGVVNTINIHLQINANSISADNELDLNAQGVSFIGGDNHLTIIAGNAVSDYQPINITELIMVIISILAFLILLFIALRKIKM